MKVLLLKIFSGAAFMIILNLAIFLVAEKTFLEKREERFRDDAERVYRGRHSRGDQKEKEKV